MGNNRKVIVKYDVVNRAKIEKIKEFKSSLFAAQYEEASILVSEIIKNDLEEEICSKEEKLLHTEFCNVVSFLGGRGTGKTSAMYSYSTLLRDYNQILLKDDLDSEDKKFLLSTNPCDNPSFLVLDPINASMLGNNEGVLEVVLAKMWDYYDNQIKNGYSKIEQEKQNQMAQSFSELGNDYKNYIRTSENERVSNIKRLHHLAGNLNFRTSFQKFTKKFLNLFSRGSRKRLVLVLDDVDMAGKNSFKILEQIHLFLSVPNIIILLTADLKRLRKICSEYFLEIYAKNEVDYYKIRFGNQSVIKRKDEFADDYLGKIIPSNMRINMPDIYELNPDTEINFGDDRKPDGKLSEKLLNMLFKGHVQFDGKSGGHHFLEETTLRGNANMLHELKRREGMNKQVKEQSAFNNLFYIVDWLSESVRGRLLDRVEIESQKEKLEKVFRVEINHLNKYLVGIIGDEISENIVSVSSLSNAYERYEVESALAHYGLGEVLYGCRILENCASNYTPFIDFILAFYTEVYTKFEKEQEYLIGRSMWGNWTDSMILNFKDRVNQYALNSWDAGLHMSLLELELTISVADLEVFDYFSFDYNSYGVTYDGNKLKTYIKSVLHNNKKNILAFQTILAFFNNSLYEVGLEEGERFFEFTNAIHKGTSGKKIGQENTTNGESSTAEGESKIELPPSVESYKIVISPKASMIARFNIDYPILDTRFIENVAGIFKRQLETGLIIQVLDIIGQIKRKDEWEIGKVDNLGKLTDIENIKNDIESDDIYLVNQIKSWHYLYPNRKYVFPVENVQMTYNIGKTLEEQVVRFSRERFYNILHDIYILIGKELKRRDDFYKVDIDSNDSYVKPYLDYPVIQMFSDVEYEEVLQKMLLKVIRSKTRTENVGVSVE